MIEVRIAGLYKHDDQRAVVLLDKTHRCALPVWIWWEDYWATERALDRFPMPFTLTHRLMLGLLDAAGGALESVCITALKGDRAVAEVRIQRGGAVRALDARPGDALALAANTGCPIFVAEAVMAQAARPVTEPIDRAAAPGRLLDRDALERITGEAWETQQRASMGGVDRVTEGVYIGGIDVIPYADMLRGEGVTRVLKLTDNPHPWPDDFVVYENYVHDNEFVPRESLERGLAFVREQRAAGHSVLIACWAGVSRSSTFVLAHLVSELGYDLRNAWDLLHARHPRSWPAPQMWESLLTHYNLPYTMDDVRRWLEAEIVRARP